jgi:ATP-dependent RNA helicase DeaD
MFSATFPPQVLRLAQQFLNDPGFINLSSDHIHVTDTEHVFYLVPRMDKDRSLIRVIEMENPASAIIFCNTRERVHYVSVVLQRYGYNADELSSDLTQNDRERVMRRIRNNELRFLVATDVASRGIDIPDLSHVILYEPPEDPEDYIHRAGRTGRAGASGVAVSLVNVLERADLQKISRQYHIDIEERPLPSEEDVQAIVSQRVTALLEADLRSRDRLQVERMQRFTGLARELAESDEDLDLLTMLIDDYYHATFHAPPAIPTEEDVVKTEKPPKSGPRRSSRRSRGRERKR